METTLSLGDVIDRVYREFLANYGDEELAAVATAAVVNDMLMRQPPTPNAETLA